MNTKMIISLGLVASTVLASAANAEERWPKWYLGLHGGVGFYSDSDLTPLGGASAELESDTGYIVGASLGYLPTSNIPFFNMSRWELEYSYRSNDGDSLGGTAAINTDTVVHSLMANWLLDFKNETFFTPYIGAGIGTAHIDFQNAGNGADDTTFAWQFLVGLGYEPKTMPNTVWGLGYRYFDTSDAKFTLGGTATELEYQNHSVEGNVRLRF